MNLGFPTRFLKKLDIYQQIRSGQGISKHKKLWRYEAAFLKTAYGGDHQHLGSFLNVDDFKEWIKRGDASYDYKKYQEIIGSLYWRDFIEARESYRLLRNSEGCILVKDKIVMKGDAVPDPYEFRPTMQGLLVGEIISEIENKNVIVRRWNKYRYSLVMDLFWLLISLGVVNVFFSEKLGNFIETLRKTSIPICNFDLGHNLLIAFLIFVFWPFLTWIYREIYLAMENHE